MNNNIEFKRGKDKKKRKPKGMGLGARLNSAKKRLAQSSVKLANRANRAVGDTAARVEKASAKMAAKKSPQTLKGAAQYIGGRVQMAAAKDPGKLDLNKKQRASLAARGAKNTAVGIAKAAPGAVATKTAIEADKVRRASRRRES